ncbi:transcriptional regulator FtrA [Pelagibius marinus]|uniref:transcriptional regulator FtrA n=1 Tax=Pelagibius marinus TaxID=2762760 RepID=UPI001872C81A|nr:transcriptional regulator FtrA [Pelagibius marinus]
MTADDLSAAPRSVVALVYDGLCTFEYGIVSEVFGLKRPEIGPDLYSFVSYAPEGGMIRVAGGLVATTDGTQKDFDNAEIVVIPGWRGKDMPVPDRLCELVSSAHRRGARLLSICSGVYVLAAAGLLDGRQATTHWRYVRDLQERFPDVEVLPNNLYVDNGDIVTSAGSSAGIDACLHIVRCDYGTRIANSVARRLVMHTFRQGGQAQFIEQPLPTSGSNHRLSEFMDSVRQSLGTDYDIASMARIAGMSSRTFQRKFLAFTGVPAMQWLTQERIAKSCILLETTDLTVEQIGYSVGFQSPEVMRYHFRKTYAISPGEYRKRFSSTAQANLQAS